jgi:aminoglycoside phosphotransferase (APT) family kinase protein
MLGEGREAEIYEWDDGTVLRLYREPAAGSRIAGETAAMRAAAACGIPVPAVVEEVTVDGRPGVVMTRIDGIDGITLLGKRPWTLMRFGRWLGDLQARLHEVDAPSELPALRVRIRDRIQAAAPLTPALAARLLRTLDTLPDGKAICHGDFHPGNVLLGRDGPCIIDWTNAARGDSSADVARTRLLLTLGALPPGTPPLLRTLDRYGRRAFASVYRRAYERRRPVDEALVARWLVVRAADRLADDIPEEVPALLAVLERSAG